MLLAVDSRRLVAAVLPRPPSLRRASAAPFSPTARATGVLLEAFYDRSSPKGLHTSPDKGLQRTSNCTPMTNSMTQVYTNIILRNKIVIPTIWGLRSPRHSENGLAEMCYLYRRTRLRFAAGRFGCLVPRSSPRAQQCCCRSRKERRAGALREPFVP